jgi:hypothetical protein
MILNYRVIVERYPFLNGVVNGSIPVMKFFSLLDEKKTNKVGRKPEARPPQDK